MRYLILHRREGVNGKVTVGWLQVFAGGDDNNAGEPETHQRLQKTPRSTASDWSRPTPAVAAADTDRKSRDFVGDDDVKEAPSESRAFILVSWLNQLRLARR